MHQCETTIHTQSVINPTIEFSRIKAASLFEPPINVRTLQNYLELAKVFLPTFQVFEDEDTGGLNRFAKVNLNHIPVLQRMLDYCRSHGRRKLRIAMKENPIYFERGEDNDHDKATSSKVPPDYTQEVAIRIYSKVS